MNRKRWTCFLAVFTGLGLFASSVLPVRAGAEGLKRRAIAAYTTDYVMGTVYSSVNGVAFTNQTYADDYDTVVVSAEPLGGYVFEYFTDNGVIVTKSSYYSFCPNGFDHNVAAHFARKKDDTSHKEKYYERYGKDLHPINFANSACIFAPGYQEDTVSVTTNIVMQGKKCVEAFDSVRGDYQYVGMYNISLSRVGKQIDKLSGPALFIFDIPASYQKQGRDFRMLRVYQGVPAVLEDLDDRDNKVTFETDCTAAYALVYKDLM